MNKLAGWCAGYAWCLRRLAKGAARDVSRTQEELREAARALVAVTVTTGYWLLVPFMIALGLLVIYPVVAYRRIILVEEPEE